MDFDKLGYSAEQIEAIRRDASNRVGSPGKSGRHSQGAVWLWKLQPTQVKPPLFRYRRVVLAGATIGMLGAWWLLTRYFA